MAVPFGEGAFRNVEPQTRFAFRLIGTVTVEAGVGQDGPDVAVELDALLGRSRTGEQEQSSWKKGVHDGRP